MQGAKKYRDRFTVGYFLQIDKQTKGVILLQRDKIRQCPYLLTSFHKHVLYNFYRKHHFKTTQNRRR